MSLIYDLVFIIYAIIYFPYLILTRRWHKDFPQRFGFIPDAIKKSLSSKPNIWIHAVSVGEVLAIGGLIRQIKVKFPHYQLVVSVTTKTGYELAQKRLSQEAIIIGSPLDFTWVAQGFVHLIKPKIYIAAETEIWPNLFRQLDEQNVPIIIVNGRLSDQSFPRYEKIKGLIKGILSHVKLFCMQSDLDARRIIALGADPARVHKTGNIKFDDLPQPMNLDLGQGIKWWICGSTHPGEEEIILDVYERIVKDHPQWRLIIAPRHIERTEEIIKLIGSKGLNGIKLADSGWPGSGSPGPETSVVTVVDTLGRLRSLYAMASIVFVGKSLCVGGGQNIIEPAFFAKPIIVGPKMENFRDIVACFKADDAIVQVDDEMEFESAVRQLINDGQRRSALGQRARAVIDKNQGATARTLEYITDLL